MFFSSNISSEMAVEMIRRTDFYSMQNIAEQLAQELLDFDFGLSDSYCTANDVELSSKKFERHAVHLQFWNCFTDHLFRSKDKRKGTVNVAMCCTR